MSLLWKSCWGSMLSMAQRSMGCCRMLHAHIYVWQVTTSALDLLINQC